MSSGLPAFVWVGELNSCIDYNTECQAIESKIFRGHFTTEQSTNIRIDVNNI